MFGVPERRKKVEKYVLDNLQAGHFKPRIAKTFPLAQIADAHRYLESNQQIGKVVVTVP
jgi:NADPH:quinone reductase-like Zn-dependent oxidoreductase